MLTEKQVAYIATIPENKIAIVESFNLEGLRVAQEIISQIKSAVPNLEVELRGSLAFKIAGAKDIDISILCERQNYLRYLSEVEKMFGKNNRIMESSIKWEFKRDGFHVDLNIIDPSTEFNRKVVLVSGKLKSDQNLLKEYEKMKLSFNGKSYREYQTAKFEFFNKILGI